SLTDSGREYYGDYSNEGGIFMILAKDEGSNRISYLSGEISAYKGLQHRELTPGILTNIDSSNGGMVAGLTFIFRLNRDDLPTTKDQLEERPIPKLMDALIRDKKLKIDEKMKVHSIDELIRKNSYIDLERHKMSQWAGEWIYFAVHANRQTLIASRFIIGLEGEVDLPWGNGRQFSGAAKYLGSRIITVEVADQENNCKYSNILKLSQRNDEMRGEYVGVIDGRVTGGRIFIVRYDPSFFSKETYLTIGWDSDLYQRISNRYEKFKAFFNGNLDNYFLDDPTARLLKKDSLKLPPGSSLERVVGVFSLVYTSSSLSANLRRFILEIDLDGKVRMKGTDQATFEGYATLYNQHLLLRFVRTESVPRFAGMCLLTTKTPWVRSMEGISTVSISSSVLGRRVVCIRADESYDDLEPLEIQRDSKEFYELDEKIPGITKYLTGTIDNFIRTQDRDNFLGLRKKFDYGSVFFRSACLRSTQGKAEDAMDELLEAIHQGFSNQEEFDAAINEGGDLYPLRNRIKASLKKLSFALVKFPEQI
ncbi:MAG: hypothetical protein AAGI38_22575, partial [Bacteroidota bacterium]